MAVPRRYPPTRSSASRPLASILARFASVVIWSSQFHGALTVIEDEEGEDQGEDGDGDDRRNDPDHAADRRPEPCADAIRNLLEERTDHGWER